MKKLFIIAFLALSAVVVAQHVTPLNISVADLKLDSLRSLYQTEPRMYQAALAVVDQQLNKNAEDVKSAKAQLKAEQAHAKEMESALKDASQLIDALKKLYDKEEAELRAMQKTVDRQQRTVHKQRELSKDTRDDYLLLLQKEQKELDYALREVTERQRAVMDMETTLEKSKRDLVNYSQEILQKKLNLEQIEEKVKQYTATVKAEKKSAKSMQQ